MSDTPPDRAAAPASPFWRLLRYARPYLAPILLAMLLAGGISVGGYARAYLIKPIFDNVIAPSQSLRSEGIGIAPSFGSMFGAAPEVPLAPEITEEEARGRLEAQVAEIREQLVWIVLAAAAIVFFTPLLTFAREYTVAWVLGRINLDMKVDICSKLLALPLGYHQSRKRGDLFSRMMNDAGIAHRALELLFGDLVESVIMLLVGAAALLFVSWKLSLVMLLVGPGIFATISFFGRRIRKSAMKRQHQAAHVTSRLVEILEGIKVIKAFRAEDFEREAFARSSLRLFKRDMRVVNNRVLARTFVDGLNNLAAIGVMVFGIYLVLGGRWGLTIGDLAAFSAITVTIYRPVRTLAKGWVKLMDARPSAERYFEVIDSPVEIRDAEAPVQIGRIQRGIALRGVSFTYGREPVLSDIDLEVRAGEVVAIVGRTGAGKTTLVDLLLRFYDPVEGRIEIDGVDLRQVRRTSLLDQMAVVTQEPFLFDGTIRDNIRYGRIDASDDDLLAAARAAHVDEFVDDLPDGYETEVGAAGALLSGGQRQRITIARAILRDPAILILDEATSSLDSKSERLVQDAIQKLIPGRTVFVIAHRLSTVRAADKIVVLEEGRISQLGSHTELMQHPGLYRELVEMQTAVDAGDAQPVSG